MGITLVESRVYEQMKNQLIELTDLVATLSDKLINDPKKEWLDVQEVCQALNISKSSLGYYRKKGIIAYAQIGKKVYCKASDINNVLEMELIKRK